MKTTKTFLLALVMLASFLTANAQTKNIDIDNLYYSISYRMIPKTPLNPLFFTYASYANATKTTEQRVTLFDIEDAVIIDGQQKVNNNEQADLAVIINLGNLVVTSSNINERKVENKDKNGVITSVKFYYSFVVSYTFDSYFKIMQGQKPLASVVVYASDKDNVYQSADFESRKAAADFWNNNKEILISEFTSNLSMRTAQAASNQASNLYGFAVKKTSELLQTTDEKKHLENEAFRAACTSLKEKLETVSPNKGLNKTELEGIIEYFKSIPTKYTDTKLKADIKLRHAAYYNLCRIYLSLDEPENVYQYADLIIQNAYDPKDGEKFKKEADGLKEMLSRTKIKTRHFNPEDYL